jgi:hypothetical protein
VTRGRLVALAFVLIAIAVVAVRPAPTPGPMTRDFEAYWSGGASWNAHADPYARAIWNAERTVPGVDANRDELLPFIDPPATLLAWSLFARLPYRTAATLWLGILLATLLALVVGALRGSGARSGAGTMLAALALAIAFGPITSDLALGQLALPAFAAATLLVVLAERSMPAAALAATLAFFQPNVSAGLFSQLGRNRTAIAILLGALLSYALGAVASGWAWPVGYARAVLSHGAAERFAAIQITPAAIAYGFGAAPPFAQAAAIAAAVLAILAAAALALAAHDRFARFAAWSALIPFVAAFVHEHDLLVAYPAAIWCALHTRATARAIALAGTLLIAVDWLGLAQRPSGIFQSALLAASAGLVFVALGESKARETFRATLPVAVVFSAAAWLATAHPAPVWPDALNAFHAPAGAAAATIWLDEQRATGLLQPVAAWAALRTLSLLGCALLAYAIYRHSGSRRTA